MTEPQLKPLASRDNPFVKRLHALAHSARERRKLEETVLDGAHLVEAALAAGVPLRALVVSETGLLREEHRRLLAARSPTGTRPLADLARGDTRTVGRVERVALCGRQRRGESDDRDAVRAAPLERHREDVF